MVVMEKMKIRGNIIIGILIFSVIAWVTGLAKFNGVVSTPPPMTYLFAFDLGAAFTAGMSTIIFTLLFIDFFDTAGTLTSVANVAGKVGKDGKVQDIILIDGGVSINPSSDLFNQLAENEAVLDAISIDTTGTTGNVTETSLEDKEILDKNHQNNVKSENYFGACFTIVLPLID